MSALFKRPTVVDEELARIQKDISLVHTDVPYVSTRVRGRKAAAVAPAPAPAAVASREDSPATTRSSTDSGTSEWRRKRARDWEQSRGDRLGDILSGGVAAGRPLRHERRLQRNRAILMLVVALMLLVWFVARFM